MAFERLLVDTTPTKSQKEQRIEAFLNAPASVTYHHACPEGLLEHFLDVANNIATMLCLNASALPRLMQGACFVAGLLKRSITRLRNA